MAEWKSLIYDPQMLEPRPKTQTEHSKTQSQMITNGEMTICETNKLMLLTGYPSVLWKNIPLTLKPSRNSQLTRSKTKTEQNVLFSSSQPNRIGTGKQANIQTQTHTHTRAHTNTE